MGEERMAALYDALSESALDSLNNQGSARSQGCSSPSSNSGCIEISPLEEISHWERHIWGDLAVSDYKMLVDEVASLKQKLQATECALMANNREKLHRGSLLGVVSDVSGVTGSLSRALWKSMTPKGQSPMRAHSSDGRSSRKFHLVPAALRPAVRT